ncbi:MAG: hypothetical protein IRZ03_15675 [Acidobacterium ailaaui]|nr:hypothetical protein [Pseudacidobacterium ailaaui]
MIFQNIQIGSINNFSDVYKLKNKLHSTLKSLMSLHSGIISSLFGIANNFNMEVKNNLFKYGYYDSLKNTFVPYSEVDFSNYKNYINNYYKKIDTYIFKINESEYTLKGSMNYINLLMDTFIFKKESDAVQQNLMKISSAGELALPINTKSLTSKYIMKLDTYITSNDSISMLIQVLKDIHSMIDSFISSSQYQVSNINFQINDALNYISSSGVNMIFDNYFENNYTYTYFKGDKQYVIKFITTKDGYCQAVAYDSQTNNIIAQTFKSKIFSQNKLLDSIMEQLSPL